jgi:hypothetical protein
VQRLRPLAGELDNFGKAFDPVTHTLDTGVGDILGVLEGWARSTQARDTASHVFRFGITVGPSSFASLARLFKGRKASRRDNAAPAPRTAAERLVQKLDVPGAKVPSLPSQAAITRVLDYLLGP